MSRHGFDPKVIFITGASSGIGEALALYYARAGRVLILTGRDDIRLKHVADACLMKGAQVHARVIDVRARAEMAEWIISIDAENPVDLVVANAGISAGTSGAYAGEDYAQVRYVFDVNLMGVLNTIEPLQARMVARGWGQIALMASLAGYRGWPGAPAYCASKAAVKVYGEALRGVLKPHGVGVTVICPGFVRTRMTAHNNFSMPFIMDAQTAAKHIACNLKKNKGRIAFPFIHSFFAWLFMALADRLAGDILMRAPRK